MLKIEELNVLMSIFHVEEISVDEHVMPWLNLFVDMHNEMILQNG